MPPRPADIAIVSGARTPMGRYCEKLRDFTPMELGAIAGKEAIHRAGINTADVDHVVFGRRRLATRGRAPMSPG